MMKLKLSLSACLLAMMMIFTSGRAHAAETFFEESQRVPLVYLNFVIKAGYTQDPDTQSGLTNFMGEMLLRGTKRYSKPQIDLLLDQLGASIEVETRAESLIFRTAFLSASTQPFLDLMTEILTRPTFPNDEMEKLRAQILSGLKDEMGKDGRLAMRKFNQFLFQGHPYGKPLLGSSPDVAKLSRERIQRQYHRLFKEDVLLVIGTGDAATATIQNWSTHLASQLAGKAQLAAMPYPVESASRRLLIIDKPERTQTQMLGGQLGVLMTDPQYFPLYLGNAAIGGGSFSSRLMVEVRVKRGWSYGAGSAYRHGLMPRSWLFSLAPASKDAPQALALMVEQLTSLQQQGITNDEYKLTKQSLINSAAFTSNTPKKRVENRILEKTLRLPDGFMDSYATELEKISLADVNQALQRFLKPDRLTLTVLGTASELKAPLMKAAGVTEAQTVVEDYTKE